MKLPFRYDQFLDAFGAYNQALWPAVIAIWLLTCGALLYLGRGGRGAGRVVAAMLGLQWVWAGTAYHLAFFRPINPAATLFAALFLVEGAVLFWYGTIRGRLEFLLFRSGWSRLGAVLVGFAMLYPGVGLLLGLDYPRAPSFGLPCPTVILTIGLLLTVPSRKVRTVAIVPVVWAGIGGSAAFVLGMHADLVLLAAGAALVAFVVGVGGARPHDLLERGDPGGA